MRPLLFTLLIGIIAFSAGFFIVKKTKLLQKTDNQLVEPITGDTMMNTVKSTTTENGYSGKVLAGTTSPYLEFSQADYNKALNEGKIIILDFYANWCPICRAEAPEFYAGFNNLRSDKIIGFRVNYKDNETDEDEKKLAAEFGITYQHTKVIIKNGKQILKTEEAWDRQTFAKEISKITQ